MCGIYGFTGESKPEIMSRMRAVLKHRGPDDEGEYHDQRTHLGMVRLSIIDRAGGHQPMSNEGGSLWVVFNGEIYNYIELREELKAKGHSFKTQSDTETIVRGFEEYGTELFHKLNGMFAIAIWDRRQRKLFLIRDRYGEKPLFYAALSNDLVFGSEIKGLLCHPHVNREIDYEALSHFLSLRNIPAPLTVYKGVRSLPAGHMLTWTPEEIQLSRWYRLPMMTRRKEGDEDRLVEEIDSLLHDSVRLRLRSDVGYGAFLSGGMDSSTVVALMTRYSDRPLQTFSLAYQDDPAHKKDARFAQRVADRYGTEHHEYRMGWRELQEELPAVIRHLDQPFAGVLSSFWLSRFMRPHVTVALSGDGADDIFASYGHHRLVGPIASVRRQQQTGQPLGEADYGYFENQKDWVRELAELPPWQWRLAYAAFMETEKEGLLSNKGRELMGGRRTSDFLRDIYERCDAREDELNKMLYLDIHTLLPNEILYYNDMLSMAHSLEVRAPFLDFRLVELACSIPGSLKIRNMTLKYILRKAAGRYLPDEVVQRPKEGFVLPKNTWLREGMRPWVREVLSAERLALHGFFNHEYVSGLLERFLAGEEQATFRIWTLLVLQIWYESNIPSSAAAPGARACLQ